MKEGVWVLISKEIRKLWKKWTRWSANEERGSEYSMETRGKMWAGVGTDRNCGQSKPGSFPSDRFGKSWDNCVRALQFKKKWMQGMAWFRLPLLMCIPVSTFAELGDLVSINDQKMTSRG